jgi:hypothetical protein
MSEHGESILKYGVVTASDAWYWEVQNCLVFIIKMFSSVDVSWLGKVWAMAILPCN